MAIAEKTFTLEIYEGKECMVVFHSDSPFGAIHQGDKINPHVWELGIDSEYTYEVKQVEHIIWNKTHLRHKIIIHVEGIKIG